MYKIPRGSNSKQGDRHGYVVGQAQDPPPPRTALQQSALTAAIYYLLHAQADRITVLRTQYTGAVLKGQRGPASVLVTTGRLCLVWRMCYAAWCFQNQNGYCTRAYNST
jgi:hypothetical protein